MRGEVDQSIFEWRCTGKGFRGRGGMGGGGGVERIGFVPKNFPGIVSSSVTNRKGGWHLGGEGGEG